MKKRSFYVVINLVKVSCSWTDEIFDFDNPYCLPWFIQRFGHRICVYIYYYININYISLYGVTKN